MRWSNKKFLWSFQKERIEKIENKYLMRSYVFARIGKFFRTEKNMNLKSQEIQ